ncbi:hypothetical protein [Ovoidimarina sediminis]|uniref:hypothetical protein n=1 Tax=Ovoidimarina sediminis TaxID=3079856 RepID=UPI002912B2EC|nr:hypothetical protein [Rhodophyticola sp. MJ-SS7]MDU8944443.1 hypothetical protein [Rhodophyticola sp. MJ-SS7]
MSDFTLTKTAFRAGRWEGQATRADGEDAPGPAFTAWHLDRPIDGLELSPGKGPGIWNVAMHVPAEILADGIQTILIRDEDTGDAMERIVIAAGKPLDDDIRAEVDLLRAELDMMKRAFRRHCVETGAD